MKKRILLIGAFPKSNKKPLYGGQITACEELAKSDFKNYHFLDFIDSTATSNPPPRTLKRSIYAIKRICIYFFKINPASTQAFVPPVRLDTSL